LALTSSVFSSLFCAAPATPAIYTLSLHDALPICQVDNLVDRHVQVVDRRCSVRVLELPVELVADDRDADRICARGRTRDARQLDEDDAADDREDHDRYDGPADLEACVAVELRAFVGARALAGSVAPDE